jgi:hypothetical protein
MSLAHSEPKCTQGSNPSEEREEAKFKFSFVVVVVIVNTTNQNYLQTKWPTHPWTQILWRKEKRASLSAQQQSMIGKKGVLMIV